MAGTIDKGAGDPHSDKHALASVASQQWLRRYTASTTSIGTLFARETLAQLTMVGVTIVLAEGGATAAAAPVDDLVSKFVKHGLASAATATPANHPAMYYPCTAPVTVTATPRARPPREPQTPPRAWHGLPKVAEDDKQQLALTNTLATPWTCHINVPSP